MRTIGRSGARSGGLHLTAGAVLLAVAAGLALGGCGSAPAPTPAPTAVRTPSPTPDPHLTEPASGSAVYSALRVAGLDVVGNSAEAGTGGAEPHRRINATYAGWPLIIEEYSSAAALERAANVDATARPRAGDPPYVFAGLNIRIEFGAKVAKAVPTLPDARASKAAADLAHSLDAIIGPLRQVAVAPVTLPTLAASPASPAGSLPASPAASPARSPVASGSVGF